MVNTLFNFAGHPTHLHNKSVFQLDQLRKMVSSCMGYHLDISKLLMPIKVTPVATLSFS